MKEKHGCGFGSVFCFSFFPSYARGYEEIAVVKVGTISGFVKIEGKLPELLPLDVFRFKDICKDIPNENLVPGPDRAVRYAVVTLEGGHVEAVRGVN